MVRKKEAYENTGQGENFTIKGWPFTDSAVRGMSGAIVCPHPPKEVIFL